MELTKGTKKIINALKSAGYDGYAVGGFVRNLLLGIPVQDVDVTTSATPEQMLEVFKDFKVYKTGLKHGTLTVNSLGENIEVTTYRVDGEYLDNRHPNGVTFVTSLSEDLKRRDFTVNAMALSEEGVIDLFGGKEDLKNKVIRAVGNPDKRFQEDALRILRALRFASVLDFEIESETALAIERNKSLLKNVSVERIFSEFSKMLTGKGVERVLTSHKSVIFEIIPELSKCDGFLQNSIYHAYDVYTHTVKSVANAEQNRYVRWALLLHDIEKPSTYTIDEKGGHFYTHQQKGAITAEKILRRLKADNKLIATCYELIRLHDVKTEISRGEMKKMLSNHGEETVLLLAKVKVGDALAHAKPYSDLRRASTDKFYALAVSVIESKECYKLKDLNVNGNDLKARGYKGSEIKTKLQFLLNEVMFDRIKNEKQELLKHL